MDGLQLPPSQTVTLSGPRLLLWQSIYYIVERGLRALHARLYPRAHAQLRVTRKDLPFFGIAMGFCITLFTSPFCGQAFLNATTSSSTSTTMGLPSNAAAGVCVMARATLWISELSRLGENAFFLVHHLFSLASLVYFLEWHVPLAPVFLIFAGLVSELLGDALWLVGAHKVAAESARAIESASATAASAASSDADSGFDSDTPAPALTTTTIVPPTSSLSPRTQRAELLNALQYAACRLPTVAYTFWSLGQPAFSPPYMHRGGILICGFLVAFYGGFCVFSTARALTRAGLPLSAHFTSAPEHLRAGPHLLALYGVWMGLALAALAGVALLTYAAAARDEVVMVGGGGGGGGGLPSTAVAAAIFAAVLGARAFSVLFEDGLKALWKAPRRTLLRPGYWLHGGLVGCALGIAAASALEDSLSPGLLVAALGIALPLYEFFSRLGCASYGCCYGREVEESELDIDTPVTPAAALSVLSALPEKTSAKLLALGTINDTAMDKTKDTSMPTPSPTPSPSPQSSPLLSPSPPFVTTTTTSSSARQRRPLLWRLLPLHPAQYTQRSAAVCRAKPHLRGRPLVPVQRLAAVLHLVCFIALLLALSITSSFFPASLAARVRAAGYASFALHAVVRLVTERLRDDFRGEVRIGLRREWEGSCSLTAAVAAVQLCGAAVMAARELNTEMGMGMGVGVEGAVGEGMRIGMEMGMGKEVDWIELLSGAAFWGPVVSAFTLGLGAYGYGYRQLGQWVE